MSDTANHKPSERHTVDEVLKSLQDLIRNEALEDGKPKTPPAAPVDPDLPRKRGRPRKVVIQDAAATSTNPRRRSSASLTEELNSVLASLNDLVNTDLGGSPARPVPAKPPTGGVHMSEDLQAAAEALIVNEEAPTDSDDGVTELSFEEMAQDAEEIEAAPPPEEPPAAKPAPANTAARAPKPAASPRRQMELKVLEPGEWKETEPQPIAAPATKPAAAVAEKPRTARQEPAAKKTSGGQKPSTPAARPPPAAPVARPAPPVPEADQETIELGEPEAVTDLIVGDGSVTDTVSRKTPPAKSPVPAALPAEEPELELTLEDPTRRERPSAPVIDHEREKELSSLGLAEIDFSQVPETSSEQFAAFASSAFSSGPSGHPHTVGPNTDGGGRKTSKPVPATASSSGRSAALALDDSIPLLEDEVTPGPPATSLDPKQARELAIRAIARLNIELRKAGERGLEVKTIQRLQALLREELEKAGTTGENTRPKD